MGKEKYQKKIDELFKKSPVVSYGSIKKIVKQDKEIRQYSKQLVRNLLIKGKIKRLAKGFYTSRDDPSLAVLCFKPAYLGLQDALSAHNLWEQETIPIIITVKRARQGIRKVLGMNVLIRHMDKRYFYGYDYLKQDDFYLPYSCAEKTIIDMVYFKEKIDNEIVKKIKKDVDLKKLNSYAKKYPDSIKKSVMNLFYAKNKKF